MANATFNETLAPTPDGSNKTFFLRYRPILNSVVVKLDGSTTTAYSINGRVITFNSAPGSTISITASYEASIAITHSTVAQVEFDSGTRYYSMRGVMDKANDLFYKPLILGFGSLVRSIPILPGPPEAAQFGIEFRDKEAEFTKLKSNESFKNVVVRLLRGRIGASLETITEGRISRWNTGSDKKFRIVSQSRHMERMQHRLDRTLLITDVSTFPDIPRDQAPRLVPLPYGRVELDSASIAAGLGPGTCPAFLVDPAQSQSKYRYVAAQVQVKAILRVFVYESLLDPSQYSVTYQNFGGKTCTIIDLDADPRVASRARDLTISCDIDAETIGAEAKAMTNPVTQLKDFLVTHCPNTSASDLVTADFTTAEDRAAADSYLGAFCLVDRNMSFFDVLTRFSESFNLLIFSNKSGLLTCDLITTTDQNQETQITEVQDILAGSMQLEGTSQVASRVRYHYDWHWVRGFYGRRSSVFTAGEEARLGEEVLKDVNLLFCRDSNTGLKVSRSIGKLMRDACHTVSIDVEPNRLSDIDLSTWVGLTHSAGISSSGSGYSLTTARVVASDFSPSLTDAKLSLKLVIAPPSSFELETYGAASLWCIAPTELITITAELSATTGHDSSPTAWALNVGGDEYAGGVSRI